MSKDTHTRSGDIVSMASKIIRCLLLLPLAAVLLPGNNGNWGCDAFQHHRYPASATRTYSTGFDRDASKIRMLNDAIGAATPNTNYFWSSSYKSRFRSSQLTAKESDDDDDEAEKIAKLKAEAEAKKASAEAEAKRLKAEAEKAAKLKAEQDKKLKEAQEMLAQIQAEAEASKKAEEETAKQQAEAEEKRKQAEEEAAKLKAEEEKKKLEAKKKAEEEAAKKKAAEEEKQRLKAKKKADELATLMKAKEEAARVMAEIDAKLQAQTAEADEEEAEHVQKLQADAEAKPELDDESDEMLKKMMEEMSKVQKELESRLEAEAKQAAAKEEKEETSSETADLADRIKSGANFDPVAKTVEAEQVEKIPPPPSIKSKEGPIDTTASAASTSDASSEEKSEPDKDDEKDDESGPVPRSDPRTKGRSRKENLFDVIGRTASGGVTMDDITELKKKQSTPAPTPLPTEVMNELKKRGPPDSFGQSVKESYRTNSETKEESQRVMPDLTDMKELKKRGPPASFGSYAAAASGAGSPTPSDEKDTIDAGDKGPPASFGASVAMASSGEVPQDLVSRGTASTDASSPPQTQPKGSRKRDSNIIDVVDVEYTKKDNKKEKKASEAEKTAPMGSAPPLEVEKTVPQAPPLQVEKTVPPMKNPPKKEEKKEVVAEEKPANPIKNIGKAAVESIMGQKKAESQEETKPKTEEKEDPPKEKGMEDRVAELLKEAFSLSKEDSRVADLLQGVVAITTGKDEKKSKEEKSSGKKGRKKATPVAEEEEIDEDDDYEDEDQEDFDEDYEDEDFDDEEDDEEDEPVIMGGRNRRMDDRDDFGRNRGGPNRGMGGNRFIEDTRRPGPFGDMGRDGYFEDNDNDYLEYDANDRWRGRGPGAPRPGGPMNSGGYNVRPPPQSRGDMRSDPDDDYYFLQFGSPPSRYDEPRGSRYDEPRGSRYDEPRGSGYYNDQDDYYYDDDGAQPGAPRPAYRDSEDDAPKGPPASFGSFVANASMDKTGYAPATMKEGMGGSSINGGSGGGGSGRAGEEWGEEMSQPTGSMLSPRGVKVNGSGGKGGASKPLFVVSEDASDNGGRKKGPPSNFGKSVAEAGEQQTGFPTRSIEEEIANGGMATPTGGMATPKRKKPANPPAGGGAPNGSGSTPQGKKPLFVVSEEESGPADFGSSVAEASGSKTGWAPKTPKRATGGLEGGTLGGMRPKLKKRPKPESPPEKKEFGDAVFNDCPPVESKKKKSEADLPLSRKQSVESDMNQKHQRNPAVNLVDGGASKNPPKQVRFNGSMMAPRIRTKQQPAAPPAGVEGDSLEEGEGKK